MFGIQCLLVLSRGIRDCDILSVTWQQSAWEGTSIVWVALPLFSCDYTYMHTPPQVKSDSINGIFHEKKSVILYKYRKVLRISHCVHTGYQTSVSIYNDTGHATVRPLGQGLSIWSPAHLQWAKEDRSWLYQSDFHLCGDMVMSSCLNVNNGVVIKY